VNDLFQTHEAALLSISAQQTEQLGLQIESFGYPEALMTARSMAASDVSSGL